MLLLALIGGICGVAALASVFFAVAGHTGIAHSERSRLLAAALLASYPLTFLLVFFDLGMAAAAGAQLEGRRMRVGEALRTAHQRTGRIALWALLVLGVNFLLRLIGARLPDGLGVARWPLGLLWALATIFVVPLLALEDVSLRKALHSSRALLKRGWGEALTGLVVIGVLIVLMALPAFILLLVGIAATVLGSGGLIFIAVGAMGLVIAAALAGALRQVFAVKLYRFATDRAT